MKETRKQKIDRQRGHAADRAFDPIREAIDSGELVITPVSPSVGEPPEAGVSSVSVGEQAHAYLSRLVSFGPESDTWEDRGYPPPCDHQWGVNGCQKCGRPSMPRC